MNDCPDCGSQFRGFKCGCGYRLPKASGSHAGPIHCAYESCSHPALIRTEDGANLCKAHWHDHFLRKTRATLADMGLTTPEEKQAYCRQKLRQGLFSQRGKAAA